MRILLGSAHPYLPELIGGAQTSTHQLALAFQQRGHEVAVLAGLLGQGLFGLRQRLRLKLKLQGHAWVRDSLEYPVYRAWQAHEVAGEVAAAFGADVVMFQSGLPVKMAEAMAQTGIPTVIYLRNVESDDLGGRIDDLERVSFVANSLFTQSQFKRMFDITSSVIYPMVDPYKYRTVSSRQNVTFINPHPHKGVDIALDIAACCPDIPFVFIKTWSLSADQESYLRGRVAQLSNVTVLPSTTDMKSIYGKARIVLAPSRWEEAFGRIAAEAHLSGIPVVGSDRGGLPEAIGPGGIIVRADAPIENWVDAVRRLWTDADLYKEKSEAAACYSSRPEMDAGAQVDRVLAVLSDAVSAAKLRLRTH